MSWQRNGRSRAELRGSEPWLVRDVCLHPGICAVSEASGAPSEWAASIFVNPAQFAPREILRAIRGGDRGLSGSRMPAAISPGCPPLPTLPYGSRPTSARQGVAAVGGQARLAISTASRRLSQALIAVGPDFALFGEKDFQQLAVIRRLVADLAIPVTIVGVPTVREADGVALSSRNAYLSAAERQRAAALPRALQAARDAIENGSVVDEALKDARRTLTEAVSRRSIFAMVDARARATGAANGKCAARAAKR